MAEPNKIRMVGAELLAVLAAFVVVMLVFPLACLGEWLRGRRPATVGEALDGVWGTEAHAPRVEQAPARVADMEAIAAEQKAKRLAAVEQLRLACEANAKHKDERDSLRAEVAGLRVRLRNIAEDLRDLSPGPHPGPMNTEDYLPLIRGRMAALDGTLFDLASAVLVFRIGVDKQDPELERRLQAQLDRAKSLTMKDGRPAQSEPERNQCDGCARQLLLLDGKHYDGQRLVQLCIAPAATKGIE